MNEEFIPLSVPNFSGNEKKYVEQAVVSEWVSTGGSMVGAFEEKIAQYTSMPRAVACNSGTSGLHLAMLVAGIGEGCEVIVPALTFIAAVNPVSYTGAKPVFIGCDQSLCIDPDAVEYFCTSRCEERDGHLFNKASGKRVAALLAVHVFGNMADMVRLSEIAQRNHLVLLEDATEALGTYYTEGPFRGRMAGTIGDVGVYSFNGNKLITTGAGGMLVTNHPKWAERAKHLSTQAKTDEVYYTHDEIGYNYRMTNLQAALGLAQLEQIERFIQKKTELYNFYQQQLEGRHGYRLLPFREDTRSNRWFFSLVLSQKPGRDETIQALAAKRIQSRPIWDLIHLQKPYQNCEAYAVETAKAMQNAVINLPCSTGLSLEDAGRVARELLKL